MCIKGYAAPDDQSIARELARTAGAGSILSASPPIAFAQASSQVQLRQTIPIAKIREQTGHMSDDMVTRYIRQADLFTKNAARALL
jgi:hypothetical protein